MWSFCDLEFGPEVRLSVASACFVCQVPKPNEINPLLRSVFNLRGSSMLSLC